MTDAEAPTAAAVARARLRLLALAAVVALTGLAVVATLALHADELGDDMDSLGMAAGPVLVLVGALLIVALVPAGLVAGAAGFALGTAAGTAVGLAAAVVGGAVCCGIGRRAGTDAARHAFGGRMAGMIRRAEDRPLRTVIAARLLPGVPFGGAGYALGCTTIGHRDLAAGTAVGFAPRCFAYAALGGSLGNLQSTEAKVAVGASVTILLLLFLIPLLLRGADGRAG